VAEKECSKPERERTVLDEAHGFPHVEPVDPEVLRRQAEEDLAARRDSYEGRHRRGETAFAVLGVAA
jgi:hypothetical protein